MPFIGQSPEERNLFEWIWILIAARLVIQQVAEEPERSQKVNECLALVATIVFVNLKTGFGPLQRLIEEGAKASIHHLLLGRVHRESLRTSHSRLPGAPGSRDRQVGAGWGNRKFAFQKAGV